MEWILKATQHKRWVQRHDHGVCYLTGIIDDALIFDNFIDAEQTIIDIGRSDLEINGYIYYEDL